MTSRFATAAEKGRRIDTFLALGVYGLLFLFVLAIGFLCGSALYPSARSALPERFEWFGQPSSWLTFVIVLVLFAGIFLLRWLPRRELPSGAPMVVLAAMALLALILGMCSYWRCHGNQSPFFTPLAWSLGLFAGNLADPFAQTEVTGTAAAACSDITMPLALEIARLVAIVTTLAAAVAAAFTLFRSQFDRVAVWRAKKLTVVVAIDDDVVSMIRAIAESKAQGSTLVVLTQSADRECVRKARQYGARVLELKLQDEPRFGQLKMWHKLNRLYLLSEDAELNAQRFESIAKYVESAQTRIRLPVTIRIDDPWQAEVWRRTHVGKNVRWAADAIGRYERTAQRIVDHVMKQSPIPRTLVVCGLTPLTYALSSELAQLQRERFFLPGTTPSVPDVVIVDDDAAGFVEDHKLRQERLTPDATHLEVRAWPQSPTVVSISRMVENDILNYAVVLGESAEGHPVGAGTRLSARMPDLLIYQASAQASELAEKPIVGRLFSFHVDLEIEPGAAQDTWERAARLIHEFYRAGATVATPSTAEWDELDVFYKGSNRRAVLNTLWMVETLGNHSWNSLEAEVEAASPLPDGFASLENDEKFAAFGFTPDAVTRMLEAEHNDWLKYYQDADWKLGDVRVEMKTHEGMKDWATVEADVKLRERAERNLLSALINLRGLGFRSAPKSAMRRDQVDA